MQMSVNSLAKFIFVENTKNIKINLFSSEFKNTKDLFFFVLDLFFKGIVLLYGKKNDNNSMTVCLNDLNYDQIDYLKDRLKLSFIKLVFISYHYTTIETQDEKVLEKYKYGNTQTLDIMQDNLDIKLYIYKITLDEYIYNISFEILFDL